MREYIDPLDSTTDDAEPPRMLVRLCRPVVKVLLVACLFVALFLWLAFRNLRCCILGD